jgi:2-oxoglutarate ferredoxin oxidoreductase subunit delta
MEAKRRPIDPHITWAGDYCKHCFTCIHICPTENLKFEDDEMASLGKCIQCQLCEKYCPDFALEVEPKPRAPKKAKTKAPKKKKAAIPPPTKSTRAKKTKNTMTKIPASERRAERAEKRP